MLSPVVYGERPRCDVCVGVFVCWFVCLAVAAFFAGLDAFVLFANTKVFLHYFCLILAHKAPQHDTSSLKRKRLTHNQVIFVSANARLNRMSGVTL